MALQHCQSLGALQDTTADQNLSRTKSVAGREVMSSCSSAEKDRHWVTIPVKLVATTSPIEHLLIDTMTAPSCIPPIASLACHHNPSLHLVYNNILTHIQPDTHEPFTFLIPVCRSCPQKVLSALDDKPNQRTKSSGQSLHRDPLLARRAQELRRPARLSYVDAASLCLHTPTGPASASMRVVKIRAVLPSCSRRRKSHELITCSSLISPSCHFVHILHLSLRHRLPSLRRPGNHNPILT